MANRETIRQTDRQTNRRTGRETKGLIVATKIESKSHIRVTKAL